MAASEPTSSLSLALDALYPLVLSQYLGTLTAVWAVPLLGTKFTSDAPFPHFYDAEIFGVEQRTDSFRSLNPKSVSLPSQQSLQGLDCGLFRQEPAITEFDRHFTPSLKLEERLHAEPLQASTQFYPRFTLLKASSPGFGSHPSYSGHFHTPLLAVLRAFCFRCGYPFGYPHNSDALPGTLFETYATTPKSRSRL